MLAMGVTLGVLSRDLVLCKRLKIEDFRLRMGCESFQFAIILGLQGNRASRECKKNPFRVCGISGMRKEPWGGLEMAPPRSRDPCSGPACGASRDGVGAVLQDLRI